MKRLLRSVAAAVAVFLVVALGVGPAHPASAVANGVLTFTPSSGAFSTNITLKSDAACPAGTTQFGIDVLSGPAGWAGTQLTSIGTAGIDTISSSGVAVDNLTNIAAANALIIAAGAYQYELVCYDASFATTKLFVGDFSVTNAVKPGAWAASGPTATTTGLAVTPPSSQAVGSAVGLTATITPSNAVGTVTFTATKSGGSPVTIASGVAVSSGTATTSTSALTAGTYTLTAAFTPTNSANFGASAATAVSYTISASAVATSTTLAASPASTQAAGSPVGLTATITPSNAAGTVTFTATKSGGAPVTVASNIAVTSGTATTSTSALTAGTYTLNAAFSPTSSASFTGSSATGVSYTITAVTPPTTTTTTLAVAPVTQQTQGQSVTLTATLSPGAAAGQVQFTRTASAVVTNIGSPVTVAAGQAQLVTTTLPVGSFTLSATFVPTNSATYSGSSSAGTPYTIAPTGLPTGTLVSTPANGLATLPFYFTTSGGCPVATTQYGMDINDGPAGWAGTQVTTIGTAGLSTSAAFQIPSDSLSSIAAGNSLTLAVAKYTFRVTCYDGAFADLGEFVGSLWVTSVSGGNPPQGTWQNTDPGTSVVDTTVTFVVTPDGRQDVGQPITLTATLTPPNAVGKVQFKNTEGGTTVNVGAAVTVVSGTATVVTSGLPFGMYTFTASFVATDPTKFKNSTSLPEVYVIALPMPPSPSGVPVVTGSGKIGAALSCVKGSWANKPTSYTYQWLRGSTAIRGATRSTYVIQALDYPRGVRCRVTATNAGGSVARSSLRKAVIPLGRVKVVSRPTVSGTGKVGKVLAASGGRYRPSASVHFQWLRNGVIIKGATRSRYKLTAADRAKGISCRVTAIRAGYVASTVVTKRVVIR